MGVSDAFDYYAQDISDVGDWCNAAYDAQFKELFSRQSTLFNRLNSKSRPITDGELEDILINIPLDLFEASERLAAIQTHKKVIDLALTKRINQLIGDVAAEYPDESISAIKRIAEDRVLQDRLLTVAYEYLITRVDKQMSYSRELIMGAKKLWDARRRTEGSNPIGDQDIDMLPEYVPKNGSKQYVK